MAKHKGPKSRGNHLVGAGFCKKCGDIITKTNKKICDKCTKTKGDK